MDGAPIRGLERRRVLGIFLLAVLAVLLLNSIFTLSFSNGPNWRNVSIDTRVNITNAGPEIQLISLEDPITLNAGTTTFVACNVTVRDFNGFADINNTNATFYHSTSTGDAADDNNTHYTNTSCAVTGQNGDFANFTCGFTVYYYALNGTWTCNATTIDNASYTDNETNTTTISELLALNVTALIDYGNLSVGQTSANQTANVTNIGNVPINISVRGWGGNDTTNLAGQNLSFICEQGNISVEYQRFSVNDTHDYSQKLNLSSTFQNAQNLTIAKQTVPGSLEINTTYWQLYVPPNPFGLCNGTVVFQAESST